MRDRIISHLVRATTRYRRIVLLVAAVLVAASVILALFFLDADLTFKGMIGSGVKVVDEYDRVIRDFRVSGVITVTLEPDEEGQKQIAEQQRSINKLVLDNLDDKGRERTIGYLHEYVDDGFQTLSDRAVIRALVEIFRVCEHDKLSGALNRVDSLDDERRKLIITTAFADQPTPRDIREVTRRLRNVPRTQVTEFLKLLDGLSADAREAVVLHIMTKLSVFDKRMLLAESETLTEQAKEKLGASIDDLEANLESLFAAFKEKAQRFGVRLQEELVSEDITARNKESNSSIVQAVLYSDEFSVSSDQKMFLLMVSPQKNIDEMTNAKQFTGVVDYSLAPLKKEFPDLRVRRTGFAAAQMDAQKAMFDDFGIMMLITAIGILVVFLLGLKSIDFPLLSMIPLVVGVVVMFGLYSLVGTLNLFSMMTPIILFGLGIDYAIHFGSRYGEVRLDMGPEASQTDVLTVTFQSIGSGLLIASLTTVFAFLSLTLSNINGFAEAGILAASGVVSAFISMMYLLPILVTWRERRFAKTGVSFLQSQKYDRLGRLSDSAWGTLISLGIVGLALSAIFFLPRIGVERDGMKLTPQVESVKLSKDLEEKYNFTDAQSYFIVEGYENLKRFRRELARTEDGMPVYPAINTSRVMDARKAIRTFEKMGWDRNIDTLPEFKDKYAAKSTMMGGSTENIADFYDFIVRNYVDWDKDLYLVIVPPSGFVWDSELTDMYVSDLTRLEDKLGVQSAGFIHIWKWLIDHMMGDLVRSSIAAFILMLLIILLTMRSVRATIICSFTMLVSFASTLSIVGMLGIKFNYVNVISFPLIIGLGIDYIVHIYHRLVHTEKGNTVAAISSTGKAVFLTTMTTLLAFGTISFSIHKGLAQTGLITCVGLVMALLSSLFVIPSLVRLLFAKK